MKLMHLSDLHLGKRLMDVSLLEDQSYILQQILNLLDAEQPDALLIAGDVYDRANPSADAVQLLDDFLQQPGLRTCGKPWPQRVIGPGVFVSRSSPSAISRRNAPSFFVCTGRHAAHPPSAPSADKARHAP